jgi:HrpA-like RNA helicase
MVVFCTNVAETSLTVPGVKIVIDSGLAKEARYDATRRMTIVELVRISRSSADQRKGRAGRLSEGVCIRLFHETELVRPNIEPEILRASLDKVVLQLLRLDLDAATFPFMSAPDPSLLAASIKVLEDMLCVTRAEGSSGPRKITRRGELFDELPFDPRLSQFCTLAFERFDMLHLAALICAVTSAPGSIFFMGGGKTQKTETKKRIATQASEFDSDLFFLSHTALEWYMAGKKAKAGGSAENSPAHKALCSCNGAEDDKGCRKCRQRYAMERGLNNKLLDIVFKDMQMVRLDRHALMQRFPCMQLCSRLKFSMHQHTFSLLSCPSAGPICCSHLLLVSVRVFYLSN